MATSFIDLKALSKRIGEVKKELEQLQELHALLSKTTTKKPGRPAKINSEEVTNNGRITSKRGRKFGKRGAVGKKILEFLSTKGKSGAHIKEIAVHVGAKPNNVTAWMYGTGKSKVRRVNPATFAIKK